LYKFKLPGLSAVVILYVLVKPYFYITKQTKLRFRVPYLTKELKLEWYLGELSFSFLPKNLLIYNPLFKRDFIIQKI
jgi:hypothetical protein